MNILFISRFGDSYGLASKMAEEGNTVWYWIDDKKYHGKGEGIKNPKRVHFYEPYLDRADVIIFDMTGLGALADRLKGIGKPVIGASRIADKMERDRTFAQGLMTELTKADIPDYKEFKSIKEGISFLEGADCPYCFKPDAMKADMPTSWTFVPKDEENHSVISFMQNLPKQNLDFILQEKIEGDKVEISTEGWFNGEDWIPEAFNHTIERKRFMEGDKGPNCGCMGNIVCLSGKDKLVKTLLLPLTDFLRKHRHVGPIDVNAMVTKDKVYFLEFTPRFGYDAIQAFSTLLEDKAGFFKAVATGEKPPKIEDKFAMAVRLSMPPYPLSEDDHKASEHLKGMKVMEPGHLKPYIWPADVMEHKGEMVMAGTDGIVGTVCASGDDIEDCREMVYDIIDEVSITNDMQFRSDIGKGDDVKIAKLKEWGWIK